METRNLRVSVENFGPVAEGCVEMKPLTIFIGPNNSGKSYVALLVYALTQALSGRLHTSPSYWRPRRFIPPAFPDKRATEIGRALRNAFAHSHVGRTPLRVAELPQDIQEILRVGLQAAIPTFGKDLEEALREYLGCNNVKDLVRVGDGPRTLAIRLNEGERDSAFLGLQFKPESATGELNGTIPDLASFSLGPDTGDFLAGVFLEEQGREIDALIVMEVLSALWSELLVANGFPSGQPYYLPAARSGILQAWNLFVAMGLQSVRRRIGLERIEVPPLTGVASDFLQVLLLRLSDPIHRPMSPKIGPALAILENQVFGGEVTLEKAEIETPSIVYKTGNLRLPVQRASSMVAELAPLALWTKYLLQPGDLLIIDEPEAHLHPENQRRVATVLVRLVRAGVRVLCTTHSPLILHQVSNHLLASEASSDAGKKQGFTDADLLKSEQVGVYLFDLQQDGTHVRPVPIEPGFGISEDEFVRVAEEIGDETYRLSTSAGR